MLSVAICDSSASVCCQLEKVIQNTFRNCKINFEEFSNGAELYHSFCTNNYFHIIIMDISQNKEDDLTAISYIQNHSSRKTVIIYLSSTPEHIEYATAFVDTHPYALLPKPIDECHFTEKIITACHELLYYHKCFSFKSNGYTYHIPLKDILYIEKSGRILKIYTDTKVYTTYCKIEEAYHELQVLSNAFIRIQYSYIINIHHITRYSSKTVCINNIEMNISKPYRNDLFGNLHSGLPQTHPSM